MALTLTVRGNATLPSGLCAFYGDWTGSAGDAAGTLGVGGGYPIMVILQKFDTQDGTMQFIPRVEASVSGNITTLTIENQVTATTGRFFILKQGK